MESLQSDKMRNKGIGKLVFEMSMPAIFSMLVQALYNIVDSIFVLRISDTYATYNGSMLGDDSFLAVSIAYPMTMFVIALGIGIGVGVNTYIARKLGEGKRERANNAAKTAIVMDVIVWAVLVILAFTVVKPFVRAFVTDNASDKEYVFQQSTLYLSIYMAGSLGCLVDITCARILQATGNMKMPMISQLIGAICNTVLDALFIFVFKWGVLGAIVATVVSQWLAASFDICVFIFQKHDVSIGLKGFKLEGEYVKYIAKTGLPAFVMNAMGSVINIILNIIMKDGTGIHVLAAYFKVQSFIFMPVFGLMQGAIPIMSYNYGANLKQRFNQTVKNIGITSLCILGAGMILFEFGAKGIMQLLSADNPQVVDDGIFAFKIICLSFIPAAFSIVIINMLQSINRPYASLLMSLCRQLIVLLPSAFFLFYCCGGQNAIWWCYPIAEVTSVLIFLPIAFRAYKKQFEYKQRQYDELQSKKA